MRCNFYLWFQLGKVFFLFLSDYLKFKYNVLGVVMRAKHGRLSYLHFVLLCLTFEEIPHSLEFLSHYFFKYFSYSFFSYLSGIPLTCIL